MTPENKLTKGKKSNKLSTEYKMDLPSGQKIKLIISQVHDTIDRKVKVKTGVKSKNGVLHPVWRNVRDKHGNHITTKIKVQAVHVTLRFQDGEKITARSCCKPPDVYKFRRGKRIAIRHLFEKDRGFDPKKDKRGVKKQWKDGEPKRQPRLTKEDKSYILYSLGLVTNTENAH